VQIVHTFAISTGRKSEAKFGIAAAISSAPAAELSFVAAVLQVFDYQRSPRAFARKSADGEFPSYFHSYQTAGKKRSRTAATY